MSEEARLVNESKKAAGYKAVDDFVKDGMVVGVGSGSTVVFVAERLSQRVKQENLNIICVPTSFQSTQLINEGGLRLGSLSTHPSVDVTIDGADEVDSKLNLIKGGGACQLQEKIVAANSKQFVVVADYRKISSTLGENWKQGVPIEVIPGAYVPVMKRLEREFNAKATLRMADPKKAGPVVTDNGNFVLDVDFGLIKNPEELNSRLLPIVGIVETGLFINMVERVYFGMKDGTVKMVDRT